MEQRGAGAGTLTADAAGIPASLMSGEAEAYKEFAKLVQSNPPDAAKWVGMSEVQRVDAFRTYAEKAKAVAAGDAPVEGDRDWVATGRDGLNLVDGTMRLCSKSPHLCSLIGQKRLDGVLPVVGLAGSFLHFLDQTNNPFTQRPLKDWANRKLNDLAGKKKPGAAAANAPAAGKDDKKPGEWPKWVLPVVVLAVIGAALAAYWWFFVKPKAEKEAKAKKEAAAGEVAGGAEGARFVKAEIISSRSAEGEAAAAEA